jgi:hypothetical protein
MLGKSQAFELMVMTAATSVAASFYYVAYIIAQRFPSEEMMALIEGVLWTGILLWLVADAQERKRYPCYDFGFLMGIFFPSHWFGILCGPAAGRDY